MYCGIIYTGTLVLLVENGLIRYENNKQKQVLTIINTTAVCYYLRCVAGDISVESQSATYNNYFVLNLYNARLSSRTKNTKCIYKEN